MLISVRELVRKMRERGLKLADGIRGRLSKSFDAEFGGRFMAQDRFMGADLDSLDQ